MERAREAAEQARSMANRPVDGAAVEDDDGGAEPGPQSHHRSAFSVFADKLEPGALADLVQKAGTMQEKVNATLRERGVGYRISEVCFTATFPPQISFYIATAPPGEKATDSAKMSPKAIAATTASNGATQP